MHGFAPGDRYRIGVAVEGELARLFAEQGVPSSLAEGRVSEPLDGGAFEVVADAKAETVGTEVARSVYRGLAKVTAT